MAKLLQLLPACGLYRFLIPFTLFLTFSLNVDATSVQKNETVTFSAKDVKLREIFKEIKKQTGYSLMYSNKKVPLNLDDRVSVDFNKSTISEIMEYLLRDKNLQWQIDDESILIFLKPIDSKQTNLENDTLNVIPRLSGRVTDADGRPVHGATVLVKGTERGTTTDHLGDFILNEVKRNSILLVSSIGYETRELTVKAGSILVKLNIVVSGLDETVVIAYGTTTKRLNTGNISTVKSKDIEKQPVSNPLNTLQGRVPGLIVTQNSGMPGGGFTVQIRGQNSIINGNDPLYIIDGVPYTSQLLANTNPAGGNPLNFINPADIESIDILKDADATAIYGSRGANGVIYITTKKGKAGKIKFDANFYAGFGNAPTKIKWLNTHQYLEMRKEAFRNDNEAPTTTSAPDLLFWDSTRYTDWQKTLIGKTAHYSDAQFSLSGGSQYFQYLMGTGYHRESTVFPFDGADSKVSTHFNVTSTSLNQRLKLTVSGNYVLNNSTLPKIDLTNFIRTAPNSPPVYTDDGELNWENSSWGNPFAFTKQKYEARTTNLVSNAFLTYQLLKWLELKCSFGYTNMEIDEISTTPIASQDPSISPKGSSTFVDNNIRSWIIEPQVTYVYNKGRSTTEALIGTTFQKNSADGKILVGRNYTSDDLLENLMAAPNLQALSQTNSVYKYNAVFGRFKYNYQNKYLLNLTMRRDGSSRFGKENRFHNFYSAGIGWIFSEEAFCRELSFLSYGKLRGSYGTTGSDQINDYRFYDLFRVSSYTYQGTVGLNPRNLYNPSIAWEETRKLEAAVELGFFNDKVLFTTSHYRNRSSNQLLDYTLSAVTGYTSISANIPATVQNNGWEFTLDAKFIASPKFNWTGSFNISIPQNKLIAYDKLENSAYKYSYLIGQPVNVRQVYAGTGVDPGSGVYKFIDAHENTTMDPSFFTDRTIIINTNQRYYGGVRNDFNYKGFQLEFLFQFVKQTGIDFLLQSGARPGEIGNNQPLDVLNRWRKEGDHALVQRFTQSPTSIAYNQYQYAQASDLSYIDASFIRLKSLLLSYKFSSSKIGLNNCLVYLQGQNFLTITDYRGMDPENQSISSLPPLRVVTLGVRASF